MALTLADRVQETTTTTGSGTITLAGAVAQFQSFASGIGSGNTCYYCLLSGDGVAWETGLGTVGGSGPYTLARTTVLASSASGAAISLSGTSAVFCDLPASEVVLSGSTPRGLYSGVMSTALPSQSSTGLSTWANQGAATETDTALGMTFSKASNGSAHALNVLYKSAPATPYTATALFKWGIAAANASGYFFGWRSSGGAYEGIVVQATATMVYSTWSNATTIVSGSGGGTISTTVQDYWLRLTNDGTNVTMSYSIDGVTYQTIHTSTIASGYLGTGNYNQIAVGTDAYNGQTTVTVASYTD